MSAMPLTGQPFICIHGSLRRSCETCDLAERLEVCEKERDAALAESQHDKELTCGCGLYVHHSRWNPKARHINDCPFQTLASLETALAERDRFGANAENFRQSMYALESDLVSLAQERDALRDNLYPMTYQKAVMALTEARRVLRRCHEVLANQGYQLDDDDPESLCSQVAAVLAQEEK